MPINNIIPATHKELGFGFIVTEEYFLPYDKALTFFEELKEQESLPNDNRN